jgi:hypothetical protein
MSKRIFYTWIVEWDCNVFIGENEPHLYDTYAQCIDALLDQAYADWGQDMSEGDWLERHELFRSELLESNYAKGDFGHEYSVLKCTYDIPDTEDSHG